MVEAMRTHFGCSPPHLPGRERHDFRQRRRLQKARSPKLNPQLSIDLQAPPRNIAFVLAAVRKPTISLQRRPKQTLSSTFRTDLNKPLIYRSNLAPCLPHHHELVNDRPSLQSM
jgi:hypothetical protein